MNEYTPGPWEIIQLPSMAYRIDAKVGPLHVCPAIAHGLSDARLISAAPDLLAALKCFLGDERYHVSIGGNPRVVDRMVDAAFAAVAKAEGTTP